MTIPKYAAHVPPNQLVRIICKRRCGHVAFARLVAEPNPLTDPLGDVPYAGYVAYCLLCDEPAWDSYNWLSP
jgi:hypothetical protein